MTLTDHCGCIACKLTNDLVTLHNSIGHLKTKEEVRKLLLRYAPDKVDLLDGAVGNDHPYKAMCPDPRCRWAVYNGSPRDLDIHLKTDPRHTDSIWFDRYGQRQQGLRGFGPGQQAVRQRDLDKEAMEAEKRGPYQTEINTEDMGWTDGRNP